MTRSAQLSLGRQFSRQSWQPADGPAESTGGGATGAVPSRAESLPALAPASQQPATGNDVQPWWGSARPHGVRAQDWEAIKNHRHEAATVTAQFERELAAGSLKPVLMSIACPCSFLPYPHLVASFDEETRWAHNTGKSRARR